MSAHRRHRLPVCAVNEGVRTDGPSKANVTPVPLAAPGRVDQVPRGGGGDLCLSRLDGGERRTAVRRDLARHVVRGAGDGQARLGGDAGQHRIHQTGGTVDNAVHQIADDPLFSVGETAALFLVEYQPGYYRVAGGPTGRFEVNAGNIAPVNDEGIAFSGTTDAFKAEVDRS